ncbi:transcriptional regulator [Echinicola pacifica]|uniref:Transcriptional regulator n=1 Tax=Echinicola pacifica TaxID=346377 RepID=A0A918UIN7_9BACT|nr:substrate-binding domain-containing protein [Echinicola pacifica]GGZ14778.1 transcriptional regulator [Echinicola pacifica]
MDKNKIIRIKDIAKLSGVSVGTVDRVIHERGKVSEVSKAKVEKVLKEINYTPNLLAKTLGSNKVFKIALLAPHLDEDPYWNLALSALGSTQKEWQPYHIEILPFYFELHNADSYHKESERLLACNPDAVISAPIYLPEALTFSKKLKVMNIPFIHFNTLITEADPLAFIGQDLYQSGRLAASLLNLVCHDQKGSLATLHIVQSIQHSIHFQDKENGFNDYCKALASPQKTTSILINAHTQELFEASLLKAINEFEVKGLFIPTSSGAKKTAEVLRNNHLKDIKIVGYDLIQDNIDLLRSGEIEFLINQSPNKQLYRGVYHLAHHLLFKNPPPKKELFPLEIITRENIDSYTCAQILNQ